MYIYMYGLALEKRIVDACSGADGSNHETTSWFHYPIGM